LDKEARAGVTAVPEALTLTRRENPALGVFKYQVYWSVAIQYLISKFQYKGKLEIRQNPNFVHTTAFYF